VDSNAQEEVQSGDQIQDGNENNSTPAKEEVVDTEIITPENTQDEASIVTESQDETDNTSGNTRRNLSDED